MGLDWKQPDWREPQQTDVMWLTKKKRGYVSVDYAVMASTFQKRKETNDYQAKTCTRNWKTKVTGDPNTTPVFPISDVTVAVSWPCRT